MKNFVKHTLAIAICAVALLSSCIKEQPYELKIAQLEVAVTRADASTSQEQGDGIGNAMFWVFKCSDLDANGAPTAVPDEYAASWRVMHTVNQSKTMTVHMELPLCDTDHQDYILVAILNTDAFGETIELGQYTKFAELQQALFNASSAEFWDEYPVDEEGNRTPWKMPISNWKTFTVSNSNTHPDNCYELQLPVYRAVAKAQLFVQPKSDNFTVTVTDAKIHSAGMPTQGAILTAKTADGLNNNTINGAAVKSQQGNAGENVTSPAVYPAFPYGTSAGTRQLYNAVTADSANDFADVVANTTTYTWAGSTFIYENAETLTNTTDYKTVPTGNNGYYMEITYQVSGDSQPYTRYVALPAVVRNHDYQVKATVDAGGQMTLTIVVNEWNVDDWQNMDYQNTVVVEDGNHIKWWNILNENTDIFKPDGEAADVTNNENVIDGTNQVASGKLYFKGDDEPGSVATCSFTLKAPVGGEWYAELVTITGDPDHFVFEKAEVGSRNDGVFVVEETIPGGGVIINGDIKSREVMLYLKTVKTNSMTEDGATEPCVVELQITAKKDWGGRTRTYKVYGLIDIEGATFTNYELNHLLAI